jgi:hypothetical protein
MNRKPKTKIGDIHNDLTVISVPYLKIVGKSRRYIVKVRCKCSREFIADSSRIRTGETKSCKDCSFRARSLRNTVSQIEQIFRRLVIDRSKKHNIDVTITSEDYFKIASKNCYYCNDPPAKLARFKNRKYVNNEEISLHGIDRLDSKKGYHIDNIVSCCTSCNYAKHKLSEKEFINKIMKIYKNLNLG